MKKEIDRKHYSIFEIIFLLFIGSIFVALGIGILSIVIKTLVNPETRALAGAFVLVPIVLFVIIPIVFGSIPIALGSKQIYHWARASRAKKSDVETEAKIVDYKVVSHNGRLNKRYSLILSYELEGEHKTFTTDYIFEINEFRYLRSLESVKVKVDRGFVVVAEKFYEEIYKLDPKYELERSFYDQPVVKKVFRIIRPLVLASVVLLVVSIVLTTVLHRGIYLMVGAIAFGVINITSAVVMGIFLFKWIFIKKK